MFKERYFRRKKELAEEKSINKSNRKIISKFLDNQEISLKRRNGLAEVDEPSYKTLYYATGRLRKLNEWLNNKEWRKLTKPDIKKLIDDLEDGVIKSERLKARIHDRSLFYQMIKGRLFKLVRRDHIARDILEEHGTVGRKDNNQVRFIREKEFRKLLDCAITPEHRALLWLAFDIGENIGTLLKLKKSDFRRNIDENGEPEYIVTLSEDNIKRTRTPRYETTNYQDTVTFLDIVLSNLSASNKKISNKFMTGKKLSEIHSEDKLFKFGENGAKNFLIRAVNKSNVVCEPEGQKVTWKDLRSSMACDCLIKEWFIDDIKARLGHNPSSKMIDKYVNYLVLDKKRGKKQTYNSNVKKLEGELRESKDMNKMQIRRVDFLTSEITKIKQQLNIILQK